MYATGEIDEGGYIYAHLVGGRTMMHKETRVRREQLAFTTLAASKEDLLDPSPVGHPGMILAFDNEGGVSNLWCYQASEEVIRTRLKLWAGCYGAWRVRRLNETVPTV